MNIEALGFIEAGAGLYSLTGVDESKAQNNFATWLEGHMNDLSGSIKSSDRLVRDLAIGEADSIHHVLLELEKTKISFQLALQVRNRLLEGYQEIMRMQV